MKKYVSFGDLYSFRGEYEHSALIYNNANSSLEHYTSVKEDIVGECGDNYVDRRESFKHIVITLSNQNKDHFVILFNSTFSLKMFNLVGSAYQRIEYIIPDDAPVEKIKELLMKDDQKWQEAKNGFGECIGYILLCVTIKVVSADEFYLKNNPINEECEAV